MNLATELEICNKYKNGGSPSKITDEYNINQYAIYRILKRNGFNTRAKKTHAYKEDVFDSVDTELKAYVLGLITSDGYIANKNNRYIVQLSSTDKEIPSFLAELIEYPRPLYFISSEGVTRRTLDEWRIMICSKRLVLALEKLGVVNNKSTREVFYEGMPEGLTRHYIRGICDGDGYLGLYPVKNSIPQSSIGICGSMHILKAISGTFDTILNVPQTKIGIRDSGLAILQYRGNRTAKTICKWLYTDCNYYLPRKHAIAQRILDLKTPKELEIEKQRSLQHALF